MYKIKIPSTKASDAIHWAGHHCHTGSFTVRHDFPDPMYIFSFVNEEDAIHFALKWK
jgi:hypothetical protein